MHQNGSSNGHTSSSSPSTGESNVTRVSLEKQMVSLDFAYHMPHFLTTATTTAASVGGGNNNSSTVVAGVASASTSSAGHGHSHSHSEHHNHSHPSVIHEGHSEGRIGGHLSPDHSTSGAGSTATTPPSNASLHLDTGRSGCIDQHSSVVIKAESSVDLSTSGNNINNNNTGVNSTHISNAIIKIERESPMHINEERHENKTTGTDGKDSSSSRGDSTSLSDSMQSDSNDNRCQSSSTSEAKSPLDSSAVTPPSS